MPEAVEVECPYCQAVLKLKSRSALGKRANCPKCAEPFVVEERFSAEDDFGEFGGDAPRRRARGGEYDFDEYDDDFDRGYDDRPRRRRQGGGPPERRQKAGWVKPTLIGLGSLAVLLLIGGGVYLAMKLSDDGAVKAKALAYLPKDAEVVGVIRVSEVVNEPMMKDFKEQISREMFSSKQLKDAGLESLDDIELIAFGMSDVANFNPRMQFEDARAVIVVRTKKKLIRSKMEEGSEKRSYNGATYYVSTRARRGMRACGYLPDDQTMVVGSEEMIKSVIDQGPTGHERSDLDFADFQQPIVFAYAPKSGTLIPPDKKAQVKAMARQWPDLVGILDRNIKGVAVGMNFENGMTWKVQASCSDASEAANVKTDLDKLILAGKGLLGLFTMQLPAEIRTDVSKAVDGIAVTLDGANAEVSLNIPQSLIDKAVQQTQAKRRTAPFGSGGRKRSGSPYPSFGR